MLRLRPAAQRCQGSPDSSSLACHFDCSSSGDTVLSVRRTPDHMALLHSVFGASVVLGASVLILASPALPPRLTSDVFSRFWPWVEIDADDLRNIHRRQIIAKTLAAGDNEIAIFLATAIDTDPDTFIEAVRDPEALWRSARIPHVGRFSTPPRLEDVADMRLDRRDVDEIRRCVPGDCDVKLAAAEISRLRGATSIQDEFREMVVERVRLYHERGLDSASSYHDQAVPIEPATISSLLLARSPWLTERAPRLAEYIEDFPSTARPGVESLVYWLETTHTPKPTIQVVHVAIARRDGLEGSAPEVFVVSRQVFASHYINGSLAVSVLLHDRAASRRYLAYVTRVHVDGLDGWFSAVRRYFVERTARDRGAALLEEQRQRIEAWHSAATPPFW